MNKLDTAVWFQITNRLSDSIWNMEGPKQVVPIWIRVDLEVIAMKVYSTFPQHQMQFSIIPRTLIVTIERGLTPL